jgi:hypothetical protein
MTLLQYNFCKLGEFLLPTDWEQLTKIKWVRAMALAYCLCELLIVNTEILHAVIFSQIYF